MSGKKTAKKKKPDRRVKRTREVLGDALVGLMQEKTFESIKVEEVLDRADVGRSTFYSHYRDKDDLFLSDVDEFWEGMASWLERKGEKSRRMAPLAELLSHVGTAQTFYQALVASGKVGDVMELGRGHFRRSIERRLHQLEPKLERERVAILASAFTGAMFELMDRWVRHEITGSPAEIDSIFHEMVWSGIPKT
jgi:AcrR family transcriptional regulator